MSLQAKDSSNPCAAALQQRVSCFFSKSANLALIRELNRPGIITLTGSSKQAVPALLYGLSEQTAWVRLGTQNYSVPLVVLAGLWRGDFATLWRVPDDFPEKAINGTGKLLNKWLDAQLAKLPGQAVTVQPTSLRDRIYAFQLAHGLNPDGQAGPMTVMQLNRAAGMTEPQLKMSGP